MLPNYHVYRVYDEAAEIKAQSTLVRGVLTVAAEMLKMPPPDTFLGRKTQEPFPQDNNQ